MRKPAKLDVGAVRKVRLILAATALVAFGLAYLVSPAFRAEIGQAAGILWRGDVAGLRDYILSFGVWAPIVSVALMILQAIAVPLPTFLVTFANGLAFGTIWGGLISLFGTSVAAVVSCYLARAFGRTQSRRWWARPGSNRRIGGSSGGELARCL